MKKILIFFMIISFFLLFSCSSKERQLIGIQLENTEGCTVYQNTHYDPTGVVVKAIYDNDERVIVTKYAEFSLIDTSSLGVQSVTVTYREKTAQYQVEIIPQPTFHTFRLMIETLPNKLEYVVNESLNLDGLRVRVVIDEKEDESILLHLNLCEIMILRYRVAKTSLDEIGEYEINVLTTYLGEHLSTSFFIEVRSSNTEIESEYLELNSDNVKKKYRVNDIISYENLIIMIKSIDGVNSSTLKREECTTTILLNGKEKKVLDEPGIYTVRISFEVLYATYTIEVEDRLPVPSLTLDVTEARYQYFVGEAFSSNGLDIRYYEDGVYVRSVDSTQCQIQFYLYGVEKYNLTEPGDYSVVITFQGLSEEFRIVVIEK